MRRSSFLGIITSGLFSIMLCGCIIIINDSGGEGSARYMGGKLQATLEISLPAMIEGVKSTGSKLKFTTVSEKTDALSAAIVLQTALDKKIKIKLTKITDTTTKIEIRVGIVGDQALSYKVFEEIKAFCDAESK